MSVQYSLEVFDVVRVTNSDQLVVRIGVRRIFDIKSDNLGFLDKVVEILIVSSTYIVNVLRVNRYRNSLKVNLINSSVYISLVLANNSYFLKIVSVLLIYKHFHSMFIRDFFDLTAALTND